MQPSNDGHAEDGPMTRWGFLYSTYCDAMGIVESPTAWHAFNAFTEPQAEELARTYFWARQGGTHLNTGVDISFIDWRWTSGGATAVIQRALGCHPDGIVGPHTIAAMNAVSRWNLAKEIHDWRCVYYDSLGFRAKYPGLYTRADQVLAIAQTLISGEPL